MNAVQKCQIMPALYQYVISYLIKQRMTVFVAWILSACVFYYFHNSFRLFSEFLDCNSREDWLNTDSIASSPNDSQSRQAEQLLLRYDSEIQTTLTTTRLDQSMNSTVIREPVNRQISKTLSWRTVLIFFIMFCVIIPIIGGLYFILKHLFNTSGNWQK